MAEIKKTAQKVRAKLKGNKIQDLKPITVNTHLEAHPFLKV
jgi:hypothetical protein